MHEVLALSLQAMHQDMQKLDRIGTNLANALTPGYKREVAVSQPSGALTGFPELVAQMGSGTVAVGAPGAAAALASPLAVRMDLRPGTLKSTGHALDVALAGPGYFEVSTDTGLAYTRQGNLQRDARGRLVTAQGLPLMGKAGEIYLNSPNPVIDAAGNVYDTTDGVANSQAVAQIRVVQFDAGTNLHRLGDGLVGANAAANTLKDADIQIRQGFLENANVSAMHEMVDLMQTMRHFESMQKVLLGYDDMTGQAIRKLGELS